MSDLTDFLLDRIAEDERLAQECLRPENLHPYGDTNIPAIQPSEWGDLARNYLGGEMGEHCAQQNPAKVLAECAAKRRIVEDLTQMEGDQSRMRGDAYFVAQYRQWVRFFAQPFAAAYVGHPDYRQEWAG